MAGALLSIIHSKMSELRLREILYRRTESMEKVQEIHPVLHSLFQLYIQESFWFPSGDIAVCKLPTFPV